MRMIGCVPVPDLKNRNQEVLAKIAARLKFDDFFVGSVFRKVTYPIGHRRFAKNPNPTKKARIWARRNFASPSKGRSFIVSAKALPPAHTHQAIEYLLV